MALPKYTKITKNGVEFIDGTDRAMYTITELSRAAMYDVGKFIITQTRKKYYSIMRRVTGNSKYSIQYWVPRYDNKGREYKVAKCIVGFKIYDPKKSRFLPGFAASFQERGTDHQKKMGILRGVVGEEVDMIRKIEAQYLSAINANDGGESLINEEEHLGED